MVNGKSKGSSFERLISKELSLWTSNGTKEDVYWRSALSGGRSTVAFAKGKNLASQAGDISAVDPLGAPFISKFYVELKFYRDLRYQGILTGKGNLVEFWAIAKRESKRYGKMPLMIAKQNQLPVVACLTLKGLLDLGLKGMCILIAPKINMHVVLFDDYLKHAQRPKNGQLDSHE